MNWGTVLRELGRAIVEIPFKIPPEFALIARAVGCLEGIALTADPNFRMVLEAYPLVAARIVETSTTGSSGVGVGNSADVDVLRRLLGGSRSGSGSGSDGEAMSDSRSRGGGHRMRPEALFELLREAADAAAYTASNTGSEEETTIKSAAAAAAAGAASSAAPRAGATGGAAVASRAAGAAAPVSDLEAVLRLLGGGSAAGHAARGVVEEAVEGAADLWLRRTLRTALTAASHPTPLPSLPNPATFPAAAADLLSKRFLPPSVIDPFGFGFPSSSSSASPFFAPLPFPFASSGMSGSKVSPPSRVRRTPLHCGDAGTVHADLLCHELNWPMAAGAGRGQADRRRHGLLPVVEHGHHLGHHERHQEAYHQRREDHDEGRVNHRLADRGGRRRKPAWHRAADIRPVADIGKPAEHLAIAEIGHGEAHIHQVRSAEIGIVYDIDITFFGWQRPAVPDEFDECHGGELHRADKDRQSKLPLCDQLAAIRVIYAVGTVVGFRDDRRKGGTRECQVHLVTDLLETRLYDA